MTEKENAFRTLLLEAFWYARDAHNCVFSDDSYNNGIDKATVLSYAAACTAKYSAATAMYWCSPELEDPDVPRLLSQFGTYTDEIRADIRDDHSPQWVDIEFEKLKDYFENSRYC